MRSLLKTTVALAATAALLAASCAPRLVPERERVRPAYLAATVEELLGSLRERNAAVSGLQAQGRLEYRFTYAGRGFRGAAVRLQFAKPGSVYVRGYERLAGTLFRLVSDGSRFWAENTRGGEVYTGPVLHSVRGAAAGETEIWEGLHPAVLAEALLLDDVSAERAVCETYPGRYIITLLELAADGEMVPRRRIWFERERLRVTRHQVFTADGRLATDALLSRYERVSEVGEGGEVGEVGDIELPHRYSISRPWEELRLELELRRVRLNPEFNEELFSYQVPPGYRVRELEAESGESGENAEHR